MERAILVILRETERELGGRSVPTAMLFGRVAERVDVSQAEFMEILTRLIGKRRPVP